MANWAFVSYAIEGPKETLKKIEQAILHPKVEEGSSEGWEGNVLAALDISWVSRNKDRENGKYMRGFIRDNPWMSADGNTLNFCAEEAWTLTDFGEVLFEAFPDIKVYWNMEESGMGLYGTNDAKGKYFPERVLIDSCIDGDYEMDYFINDESAFNHLSKITNGKIKNQEDVNKFNDEHELAGTDEDNYILMHHFEIFD